MPSKPKKKASANTVGAVFSKTPIDIQEAEVILAHVLKTDRVSILAHPERKIVAKEVGVFQNLVNRRNRGEPLPYLFQEQTFCDLPFYIDKRVLIPRATSEWLVEEASRILQENPTIQTVIDVGTGSGCLILSVFSKTDAKRRQKISWMASDFSSDALAVAKKNARRLGVQKVIWTQGDLLSPFKKIIEDFDAPILLIANLPYLTTEDYRETPESVRAFEPRSSLVAGTDGLLYYNTLLKQLSAYRQKKLSYLFEIDPCHAKELKEKLKMHGSVKLIKDQENFWRFAKGTWTK